MTDALLPPLPSLETIAKRLPIVFPEGTPRRNFLVRDMAARTVFVMFYTGAVEGRDRWLRPNQVTRMTDLQAAATSDSERLEWTRVSLQTSTGDIPDRWYADNTREPIRDETLNSAVELGAVLERPELPTTSPVPRYRLASDFAELFLVSDKKFRKQVSVWQQRHLTPGALGRSRLLRRGAVTRPDAVEVTFPNREVRQMAPGPSSLISKAVIEEFSPRFLAQPAVVWLSESRNKVVARDDELARAIGLGISADRLLPDIILVDLAPETPLLVFVEAVASEGPISESRQAALLKLATDAGYQQHDVAFVTAFMDRGSGAFRKVSSELAWGSFAWFATEPDLIVGYFGKSQHALLSELARRGQTDG
ncbi:MAG: hypothetical protein KJ000_01060 [Pirellulaceae bacterium]|nr:hypothetical protein [Pirellulaceae bacterium]